MGDIYVGGNDKQKVLIAEEGLTSERVDLGDGNCVHVTQHESGGDAQVLISVDHGSAMTTEHLVPTQEVEFHGITISHER